MATSKKVQNPILNCSIEGFGDVMFQVVSDDSIERESDRGNGNGMRADNLRAIQKMIEDGDLVHGDTIDAVIRISVPGANVDRSSKLLSKVRKS